ncbi:MAG: VWA domain-containing protein [Bacteroidia bacterium]|nr:VWA domain-containing protein [Bacteroidia bacterium]
MSLTWESPEYLLLIPLWVGLTILGLRVRLSLGYVGEKKKSRFWRAYLPTWGTGLMGLVSSFALSEPRLSLVRSAHTQLDIWVLWDVSRSMRLKDVLPDRQHFALGAMERALQDLPVGRVGLIIFASEAYAVLPLTGDREAFRFALRQVSRMDLGEGTNLSAAIETALALAEPHTHVLLVSDGAHNVPQSSSLLYLAEEAQKRQIPIHSVFIGKGEEQTFPAALKLLSEKTNGRYQEGAFDLGYLAKKRAFRHTYDLAEFLWLAVIGMGLMVLMGMALGGWFNVLTG